MRSDAAIRIVLVGLGFGAEFVPIYQNHPDVAEVAVCDPDERRLQEVVDRFSVARRFRRLEDALESEEYDAVHLLTPVPAHARQSLLVLDSGKHCACAVPMGLTLNDLTAIIAAQNRVGKNYMMMETAVYTREFLFVREMHQRGELGDLTFLRGAHIQDLTGYPAYWRGLPPMHYATHAVAPLLALTGARFSHVHCLGSGRLGPDVRRPDANPFRLETALFRVAGTDLAAEVTRSLFETARPYTESFSVYGDRKGFEWQQQEDESPRLYTLEPDAGRRGRPVTSARITVLDRAEGLPQAIARFTRQQGHGGSHPHLVHEFVRSIVEGRPPAVDAVTAARWTAAGLCAHESALREGESVTIPDFAV